MSHDQNTNHAAAQADPASATASALRTALEGVTLPQRRLHQRGRRTVAPGLAGPQPQLTPEQRLLVLDTWMRSGLPAGDYAPLVGVSKHTLYQWKARFEAQGPAGLMDKPRGGRRGSRLADVTKRAVLLMKDQHPEWGVERISAMLARGPALQASPNAVLRTLTEAGYTTEDEPTTPHPDHVRRFERSVPNQLWQSDLFTFVLKRQNQRVHLVAFMDDHSRFIVSYGLHASQSAALVMEVFRAGIASYGAPAEVLTDNGSQYVTWRGTSRFAHECAIRGVKQIVASPRHPETLGKIERFWGTLWKECLQAAVFTDLGEARIRIGHFVDHYNFQRTHQGIDDGVPADRFFGAAPAVKQALAERVAANALELARSGVPKAPFYLTGNVAGQPFTVHAEGETVILQKGDGRAAIALDPRPEVAVPMPASAMPPSALIDAREPVTSATSAPIAPPANASPTPMAAPMPTTTPTAAPASVPVPVPTGVPAMPLPTAPNAAPTSPWTGASPQPPGVSAIDRLQRLLAGDATRAEVRS